MLQLPIVLVAGSPSVGKSSLIRRITGTHAMDPESPSTPWPIETKYYHAETSIMEVSITPSDNQSLKERPEAIVLVIDSMNEATFQSARDWYHSCYLSSETPSPEICLLVVNKVDQRVGVANDRPQWINEGLQWTLDHGFELIEVSATNTEIDDGWEVDGEGHGVRRVVEALHSHQWTSMVETMRGVGRAEGPAASSRKEEEKEKKEEKEEEEEEEEEEGEEGIDEQELDAFERLLNEMLRAKDRLQGLPDQERRDEAAALAMKFASMLGDD